MAFYHDNDNDNRLNRRTDQLIVRGMRLQSDKNDYSFDHFVSMDKGSFELEVEGLTNEGGKYEAWYVGRLDTGVETQSMWGGRPFRSVRDVNQRINIEIKCMSTSLRYSSRTFRRVRKIRPVCKSGYFMAFR